MYKLVRVYVKTSFFFLFLGLLFGVYLMVSARFFGGGYRAGLVTAHVHLILVGFVIMLIMGVSLWMFPRPEKSDEHYRPEFAQLTYWLMTCGTAARSTGEIIESWAAGGMPENLRFAGAMAQMVGSLLFIYNIWSRIRPIGSHIREARGEKF